MSTAWLLFLGLLLLYVVATGKAKAVFQAMVGNNATENTGSAEQPTTN